MKYWHDWIVVLLSVLQGVWMLYDGVHAFTTGDYTTAQSGPYAGKLGPWSMMFESIGVDPRSTGVKVGFVALGLLWLVGGGLYFLGYRGGRLCMLILSLASIWYLPFGSAASAVILVIAITSRHV